MESVTIPGAALTYEEQGQGEPVVFVHGSLEDYRSWRLQMGPFARHYRAITYSRRYHYPNPWTSSGMDYSVALHAGDLADFLSALGLPPAHLVCSSYGGYVALYLAARRPELMRSLVVGEPPIMPWLPTLPGGRELADAWLANTWEPARKAFAAGDVQGGACRFLEGVIGPNACDRLPGPSKQMIDDNALEMRAEALSPDFFSPFSREDAAQFVCPVLVLQGDRSPQFFHLIADELARVLKNVTQAMIPSTSHAMHLGNAAAYNSTVLDFLAHQVKVR